MPWKNSIHLQSNGWWHHRKIDLVYVGRFISEFWNYPNYSVDGQIYFQINFAYKNPIVYGEQGERVYLLQYLLSVLSQFSLTSPLKIDGVFETKPYTAVKDCKGRSDFPKQALLIEITWSVNCHSFFPIDRTVLTNPNFFPGCEPRYLAFRAADALIAHPDQFPVLLGVWAERPGRGTAMKNSSSLWVSSSPVHRVQPCFAHFPMSTITFHLTTDGCFGQFTLRAVKAFQAMPDFQSADLSICDMGHHDRRIYPCFRGTYTRKRPPDFTPIPGQRAIQHPGLYGKRMFFVLSMY